ncbi:unnamed protein product [Linum trigynum]|uniref:Uncharacterized protein n=1 Tax=Linum trigynum TaxID=586398 RepID=A0AAV2ECB0_9ROSI
MISFVRTNTKFYNPLPTSGDPEEAERLLRVVTGKKETSAGPGPSRTTILMSSSAFSIPASGPTVGASPTRISAPFALGGRGSARSRSDPSLETVIRS